MDKTTEIELDKIQKRFDERVSKTVLNFEEIMQFFRDRQDKRMAKLRKAK